MNLSITATLAYLLLVVYLVVERRLRQGQQALSLQPRPCDRGSSRFLLAMGLLNLMLLFLAPGLNHYEIGNWNNGFVGWIGIFLMLVGLTIRYLAARTLGKFYTRTLQILEEHQIVEQGLYRVIRHPGYLGTFLMEIGAGLAVSSWTVSLIILSTGSMSRLYRIRAEEEMLEDQFSQRYKVYASKTWRLLPFLY